MTNDHEQAPLTRTGMLGCALAGVLVMGAVTVAPGMIERYFVHEDAPAATIHLESPYITAPGNRFKCPDFDAQGRPYSGWILHQSDGSERPWVGRCIYMTPEQLRRML